MNGPKHVLLLTVDGRQTAVDRSPFRIGRDSRADLVIAHASVAAIHCRIDRTPDGYQVRRCASHALRVNGRAVDEYLLYPGDTLQLGQLRLGVRHGSCRRRGGLVRPTARRGRKRAAPLDVALAASVLWLLFSLGVLSVTEPAPPQPAASDQPRVRSGEQTGNVPEAHGQRAASEPRQRRSEAVQVSVSVDDRQ